MCVCVSVSESKRVCGIKIYREREWEGGRFVVVVVVDANNDIDDATAIFWRRR